MTVSIFSHVVNLDTLGPKEKKFEIFASADQLEELADMMGVDRISEFTSKIILKRKNTSRIDAKFEGACTLSQTCVVSFKPVASQIDLSFKRIFDSEFETETDQDEIELNMDDPEILEPIENNEIDLCHPLIEELSLAIDPFPKADNTSFETKGFGPEITENEVRENSPFAVLSALKEKK